MELRQLRYFEAVARHGGFTRAADQLHVAQSAVSAQIRALEAELGTPLFDRTTRRVSLTTAGELFLARARRVLGELDGARGELDDLAAVLTGRVAIGATAVVGPYDLPAALARFHRRYPGVDLRLRSGLVAKLLGLLDGGDVDVVIAPVHDDLPPQFTARRIAAEEVLIVLPPGHPLARGGAVELAELRDESFVCLPEDSGLRGLLDRAAIGAGIAPRVQFETQSPASVRALVAAGLGVALLARSAAAAPGPEVAVRPLRNAPAHPPIGLIHRRSRPLSAAARACRRELIRQAGDPARP
jgi:DNA-binding transcriptional LysR family regulator